MLNQAVKKCSKCKEWKPATLEYFYKTARGLYGFRGECRDCTNSYNRYAHTNYPKTHPNKCADCGKEITRYSKKCNSCNRRTPALERFWSKVNKDGPIMSGMDAPCWIWIGGKNKQGYGTFRANDSTIRAHRFSYEIHNGPISKGHDVLHRCDNPSCVRPNHLFTGTDQDNNDDMKQKGRDCKGEDRPVAKLTNKEVVEIRKIYSEGGISYRNLGKQFGVHKGTVCHIVTNRTWRHI